MDLLEKVMGLLDQRSRRCVNVDSVITMESPRIAPHIPEMRANLAKVIRVDVEDIGIKAPRLYKLGFAHNNCGGGCVKAGQGHFGHLLKVLPDVYADWERNEEALREDLGDVAILRDRTGGTTGPLTLRVLRERIEEGQPYDLWEVGGCACFDEPHPVAEDAE